LKLQNTIVQKGERKFSEPISFPSCDYYKPKDANDRTLVFESRFESGNLQLVSKVSEQEYNLVIQNDINSKGHTQWFYFRVTNVKKGAKVKFNLLNMIKSKSLYNEGMKVLSYSERAQELAEKDEEKGWSRGGEDMSYYQNNYRREHQTNFQRCYYTFTFTHTFEHDDDKVYFSYSQPYTYSDLTEDLCEIQSR
jgi:cytosolic carboxypeptidase protein 2/3